jgi:hypothetical protein
MLPAITCLSKTAALCVSDYAISRLHHATCEAQSADTFYTGCFFCGATYVLEAAAGGTAAAGTKQHVSAQLAAAPAAACVFLRPAVLQVSRTAAKPPAATATAVPAVAATSYAPIILPLLLLLL